MIDCEESAYKHWYTRAQIDYIVHNAIVVFEIESRVPGDRTMAFLGYPDESEEKRSEVFLSQRARAAFHAMECARTEWQWYFDQHEQRKGHQR